MNIIINVGLFLALLIGLMISLGNWYFFCKTLKTETNHSQIGFVGGIIVYFSLAYLLPEKWQAAAFLAFLIDISFPLFILGAVFNIKK